MNVQGDKQAITSRGSANVPELVFKGKEFVYNHHLAVPFRPLEPVADKSIGEPRLDGNLIIHGDNLHALKSLLPMYAGKVDCIYIDPPYNTGNENWSYNDNVNSPVIQEWLSSNPVGIEDGLRHDKWCAMMWPRLRLLHELLSDDGVILISIDDNELCHLRVVMDEIFSSSNWVGTIVWKNVTDNNPTNIAIEHEYVLAFAKNKGALDREWKSGVSPVKNELVHIGRDLIEAYPNNEYALQSAYTRWFKLNRSQLWPLDRYKYIDKEGVYTGSQSVHNPGREGYRYDVIHPETGQPCKQPLMGYRFPEETMERLLDENRVLFGQDHTKIIELKVYAKDFEDKLPSVIQFDGRAGAYELRELFPDRPKAFDTPKPLQLIEQLLSFTTKPDSLVLDSFAGSATTAHTVARLNKVDGGNRKCILVESEDYADDLTRERMARVVNGVQGSRNIEYHDGLGGEFTFCTLGHPLDLDRLLDGSDLPSFESLGAVLFHMATSTAFDANAMEAHPLDERGLGYLGEADGIGVWLLYEPDLEFLKSREAALTLAMAKAITALKPDMRHVVYAPARFVSQKMLNEERLPVEFAPLPYAMYRIELG